MCHDELRMISSDLCIARQNPLHLLNNKNGQQHTSFCPFFLFYLSNFKTFHLWRGSFPWSKTRGRWSNDHRRAFTAIFLFSIMGSWRKISELFHLYWYRATSAQANGPLWILPVLQMVSLLWSSAFQQINGDQFDAKNKRRAFAIKWIKKIIKKKVSAFYLTSAFDQKVCTGLPTCNQLSPRRNSAC